MAIIRTDLWLRSYIENKKFTITDQCESICAPLVTYFRGATQSDIHQHLLNHGLFPPKSNKEEIVNLEKKAVWKLLENEFRLLQKEWNGPDIPVFIFPSNLQNRSLMKEFNGKTGLSYQDKIFLFITSANSNEELKALLIHEYNHTCRLNIVKDPDLNLLETIILEGIAENAVEERLGNDYLAPWTGIYSKETAMKYWNRFLKGYTKLKSNSPKFQQLLYGTKFYPKYLGYNVGYHIVASYCQNIPSTPRTLLEVSAQSILNGSDFQL